MQAEFANLLAVALSNFTLTFLVVALLFALLNLALRPKPHSGAMITNIFLRWYLFWAVGVTFLYDAALRFGFVPETATFAGFPAGTPGLEVGFALLAFGIVAILAAWGSAGMRVAAILAPAIFLIAGAVATLAAATSGTSIDTAALDGEFWLAVIIPVAGLLLLWFQHREANVAAAVAVISSEIVMEREPLPQM